MTILARVGLHEEQFLDDLDYRELVAKIQEGFFVGEIIRDEHGKAVDFRFLEVNEAFSRQTGVSAAAALGGRVTKVIPHFPCKIVQTYAGVVETGLSTCFEVQVPALANRRYVARVHAAGGERFVVLFLETTEREQIEKALQESQALLSEIVESIDQMIWSTEPDGFHDFFNRRWFEFTGTTPGTTDGDHWAQLIHPDDRGPTLDRWHHSVKTGEPYEIEHRLRHRSGEYRWLLARAHPVRDEAGEIIRWMGSSTDINEQKVLSESLDFASNELSHRIKNIFAVVSALIALSLRGRPGAEADAEELRRRIDALGKANEYARLHGSGSAPTASAATVLGLIHQLLQPYEVNGRDRILIEGDDAPLNIRASTPLALAVHELATNATKYGALSTAEGQVHITGERSDGAYDLCWTEKGGPPVREPQCFGFGSRLVEISLQNQLQGKLVREWRAEGLRLRLSAPAQAIVRDG